MSRHSHARGGTVRSGDLRPNYILDIETEGWDRFVCGVLLDVSTGQPSIYRWRDEEKMAKDTIALRGNVYAHNGGGFDFLWWIRKVIDGNILPSGVTLDPLESGSRAIVIKVNGTDSDDPLVLRDSYAMFPMALRKLGIKDETGLDCIKATDECRYAIRLQAARGEPQVGCGGYCAISRHLPPAKMQSLIDYCVADCRALASALDRMITFAADAGMTLGPTVGSTSWKSVMARGLIGKTEHNHRTWDRCKAGYIGGRCSLFKHKAKVIHRYDITSSYPHQSSQPLPDGEPIVLWTPQAARDAMRKGKPGIYECHVKVPPMYVPPLPHKGPTRNSYPIGEFFGSWALPEIEYAETLGCKFKPVSATIFPRTTTALADFMDEAIKLRLKYGKDTPEGYMIKLWANSIYGKMGQASPERKMRIGHSEDMPEGASPLDPSHMIWAVPLARAAPLPACGHVEKAAYITARARVMHHRMLIARGEDAVYGDTDSCYSIEERDASDGVRAGLGGWDYEGKGTGFVGLAPKVYTYDTPKGKKIKAKGMPIVPMCEIDLRETWERLRKGESFRNRRGIFSMRTSLRSGLAIFTAKDTNRRLAGTVSFGDRIPDGPNDSRPPTAKEIE